MEVKIPLPNVSFLVCTKADTHEWLIIGWIIYSTTDIRIQNDLIACLWIWRTEGHSVIIFIADDLAKKAIIRATSDTFCWANIFKKT